MSTTWPVHIKTNQLESSAWFFETEKKDNSYLLSCFFLTTLIVFNLSAVELTPHHLQKHGQFPALRSLVCRILS